MTGRTHDLAAFTALHSVYAAGYMPPMTLYTMAACVSANMIGGLLPDIDNQTADIWDKVRGGSVFARVIRPLLGGHRMISHSLFGMVIIGFLLRILLGILSDVILVDMNLVWYSTMIGYLSHLITDSLTKEGVPWLFPIPIRFGFPPFRFMRITTGKWAEKSLIFPGMIVYNGYLLYSYAPLYVEYIKNVVS